MLKLLFVFPLLLIGGTVAFGLALPLLALLPALLAIGAVVFAFGLVFAIFGLLARLAFGLLIGAGALLFCGLGFGLLFAGGAVVVALAAAMVHLLLPLLVIVGIVWLIRRSARPAPPPALPAPH